jgi:hypothetical protein
VCNFIFLSFIKFVFNYYFITPFNILILIIAVVRGGLPVPRLWGPRFPGGAELTCWVKFLDGIRSDGTRSGIGEKSWKAEKLDKIEQQE